MRCINQLTRPVVALIVCLTVSFAQRAIAEGQFAPVTDRDILDQLHDIDGVTAVEAPDQAPPGYRFFTMTIEQPVDHGDPDGATFLQRLVLLYRDAAAPMVFMPLGYALNTRLHELSYLLEANQLLVEHRYFAASAPAEPDWQYLTIEQSATDHHRVVSAIRPLFNGAWISTGVSKGGMTSVYHRRFFPDDMDATVAYVAPHSYGPRDLRYAAFLHRVGERECREHLKALQREALNRRDELVPLIEQIAASYGTGFTLVEGGANTALDIGVVEFLFQFWQYGHAADCQTLPPVDAPNDVYLGLLMNTIFYATDYLYEYFMPYYVQAMTQLGYPHIPLRHIADLLQSDPNDYENTVPVTLDAEFDHWAMWDVTLWTLTRAHSIMYIYGENDPWTAGAYPVSPWNTRDLHRFDVTEGNHGATLSQLSPDDQAEALAILEQWSGVSIRVEAMPPAAGAERGDTITPFSTRFRLSD